MPLIPACGTVTVELGGEGARGSGAGGAGASGGAGAGGFERADAGLDASDAADAEPCVGLGTWSAVSTVGSPTDLSGHDRWGFVMAWTGTEMLVWGGEYAAFEGPTLTYGDGGRYDPVTDAWQPMSETDAPSARAGATGVWTGTKLIVWGAGSDGGLYDPVLDAWTPTALDGAPTARRRHSAVWTGSEMIVWGGRHSVMLGDGGRYDPVTDSWSAMSSAGAPEPRGGHRAVWTGAEMIVWGGFGSENTALGTGGRDDHATDTWSALSTVDAPSARIGHTAVWTGSRMIVWSGLVAGYDGPYLDDGGAYDPATDTWSPVTTEGASCARAGHTAVWTGSRMIVWAGRVPSGAPVPAESGDLYDPVSDSWQPVSLCGAPGCNRGHGAVWTGTSMIVWGGMGGSIGGLYTPP